MNPHRGIRVSCPECDVIYRLPDASLLPIARCGRCYGSVEAEIVRGEAPAAAATQRSARS
jgi:uncharacterized paraquat-inducible protein A